MSKSIIILAFILTLLTAGLYGEDDNNEIRMTLEDVIELAVDSSLNAFIAENTYHASYWEHRNYRAQKLPFLDLTATPARYNRTLTEQFSFQDSSYHYVSEQRLNSEVNLALSQNITPTGGRVYIDSDLMRLDNLQDGAPVQFSSTLVRVGISQPLFDFNRFKWDDRIEPLRFEKAKKELVSSLENIAIRATDYFFDMAQAQINLEIANAKVANADTLYSIGLKRFEIAAISQEDLFTLELDKINSENELRRAKTQLKRARINLYSLLRLPPDVDIELIYPEDLPDVDISPAEGLHQAMENNPDILNFKQQILESEREVERARKESRLSATLNASFGLNQMGEKIKEAYQDPLNQQMVNISLNIPIIDWGLARGQYNLAQRNLEVTDATIQQAKIDFEHNIRMIIEEFNQQGHMVKGAAQADTVARHAFEVAKKRFINGNIQLTQLNIIHQNTIEARRNYINALEDYWNLYYTIRQLTLYDFPENRTLVEGFDEKFGF